jgi:2'-5' RNA ligase
VAQTLLMGAHAANKPAACIVATPWGAELNSARTLFASLCPTLCPGDHLIDPHLTVEILYGRLPDLASIIQTLVSLVGQRAPFRVPGVRLVREEPGWLSIDLELADELVDLRRSLAKRLREVGATPMSGWSRNWTPHLTVVSRSDADGNGDNWTEFNQLLSGYSFPVTSLSLSLPTDDPSVFREFGPYGFGRSSEQDVPVEGEAY